MKNVYILKKLSVLFFIIILTGIIIGNPYLVSAGDNKEMQVVSVLQEGAAGTLQAKAADTSQEQTEPLTGKYTYNVVMRAGKNSILTLNNVSGKVTWSVSNKKVVKILSKSNKKCKLKALKDGKATVTVKGKGLTIKVNATVKSGTAFTKAWCKQWVKDYITKDMDDLEKIVFASSYVVSQYGYGNTSKPEDVITEGEGTCVSGGKLLVYLCKAMGYQAKLRFAAKDDMSRYPSGVVFASQHYNVAVTIKGKTYYIDGTPGAGFVYLSTKKKLLYAAWLFGGQFIPMAS